jgi:hypothetical protein
MGIVLLFTLGSLIAATAVCHGQTDSKPATNPVSMAVGHFNGDGKADLAVVNQGGRGSVSILLGTAAAVFAANFAAGSSPRSVVVGDFNGDGKADLAVANFFSDNISILLGDCNGGFAAATNFAVGMNPRSIAVGDFNGDGKPDLAVANSLSNNVSILLGSGRGAFLAATHFAVGANPFSVTVADFNGDGKPDLAVANFQSNTVSILLGNGSGGFGAATHLAVGTSPISVVAADFNGDSKPDRGDQSRRHRPVDPAAMAGGLARRRTLRLGLTQSQSRGRFPSGDGKPDLQAHFCCARISILSATAAAALARLLNSFRMALVHSQWQGGFQRRRQLPSGGISMATQHRFAW